MTPPHHPGVQVPEVRAQPGRQMRFLMHCELRIMAIGRNFQTGNQVCFVIPATQPDGISQERTASVFSSQSAKEMSVWHTVRLPVLVMNL